MDKHRFALLHKQARKKKNLTQKELAKLTNCSHARISRIENGKENPAFFDMIEGLKIIGVRVEFKIVE